MSSRDLHSACILIFVPLLRPITLHTSTFLSALAAEKQLQAISFRPVQLISGIINITIGDYWRDSCSGVTKPCLTHPSWRVKRMYGCPHGELGPQAVFVSGDAFVRNASVRI